MLVSLWSPAAISPEEERGGSRAANRLLADADAGRRWAQRVADTLLLQVPDAFEVARRAVQRSFAAAMDG